MIRQGYNNWSHGQGGIIDSSMHIIEVGGYGGNFISIQTKVKREIEPQISIEVDRNPQTRMIKL